MDRKSTMSDAAKTLSKITGLANAGKVEEAVEELKRSFGQIEHAIQRSKTRPFVLSPHQLDTTQPEDFDYGTPAWRARWEELPASKRAQKKQMPHRLSCHRNLSHSVTASFVLFSTHNPWGVIAEVSKNNTRRCCFVKANGMRCCNYAVTPVCRRHLPLVKAVPRMASKFEDNITSEPLRELYRRHLNDPNRRNLDSEIALVRTMTSVTLKNIDIGTDLSKLEPAQMGMLVQLQMKTAELLEKIVNIEQKMSLRLNVEQVTLLIMRVLDQVFAVCNPNEEQCAKLAHYVEHLPITRPVSTATPEQEYGVQIEEGATKSNTQTKYLEDGTVIPEHFSKEEVYANKELVNAKFKPAQALYRAKMLAAGVEIPEQKPLRYELHNNVPEQNQDG